METLASGRYLSYRRPVKGGAGTWTARRYDPVTKQIVRTGLGSADDLTLEANGMTVLNHTQAITKANEWFDAPHGAGAPEMTVIPKGLTVRDVMADYIVEAKATRKNITTALGDEQAANSNILPELGEIEVADLTALRIEAWRDKSAVRGRRKTGWKREEGEEIDYLPLVPKSKAKNMTAAQLAEATELATKRRKSSVNRTLALFKSAMNLAVQKGTISKDHTPWASVSPFKGVKGQRVRFLTVAEQVRFVNACPQDFRELVRGALFTGARYSELTGAKIMDFDSANSSLRVDGKGRDTAIRHIFLTDEGAAFFTALTAGRADNDLIFRRHNVERGSRKDMKNADGWLRGDVKTPMNRACKVAQIEPMVFHELRHTYASELVRSAVPLMMVAQQLGHADTRMVEKHYGHLAPSAVKDAIRALAPRLGITEETKVQGLLVRKA
jgi:integrase